MSTKSTDMNLLPAHKRLLGNYESKIHWPIVIVYSCIIAYALTNPDQTSAFFSSVQGLILQNFNWFILLSGTAAVLCSFWMMISRYGHVRLGAQDSRPEYSMLAWISMLFCAALGTGFVIFGTAEPLFHLYQSTFVLDSGKAGTMQAIPEAIRLSIVDWSLFGWPLFAIGGWAIGYASYRHNKPLRTSTGLYGILGERCNDTVLSKIVDIMAGISTIGGVAMMIGLGVASISHALLVLFSIEVSTVGKFAIMLVFIVAYIISSSTGIARGMRYLSETNIFISMGLLLAVAFLGPAPLVYLINLNVQSVGEYVSQIPYMLFWTDASQAAPRDWAGGWFIFYILWMVTYVPFVGGFIAKISKGRTMREFAVGIVFVPTFMTVLWFSTWGGSATFAEVNNILPLWKAVEATPEQGLYMLLGSMPGGWWFCFAAFICFVIYAITTADAASFFIAQQTMATEETPSIPMRIFWGCVIGFTGILFQVSGGFKAIKSLAIVTASPFAVISFAYIYSIWKMLKTDYPEGAAEKKCADSETKAEVA